MKKIVLSILSIVLLIACKKEEEPPQDIVDYLQHFAFVNNSGVEVAVVTKGVYSNLPDSLVLENGKPYFWSVDGPYPIVGPHDSLKVYFNKTVVLCFNDSFGEGFKDPRNWANYTDKLLNEYSHEADTYTFTVEDYQRAVKQNK